MKKERLDQLLVEKNMFRSREQAKRAIMAGLIKVNQQVVTKAGTKIDISAQIEIKKPLHPYVSRGGLKLEKAIKAFQLNLKERVVLDIGASTGGFTDCALRHGAKRVYAIDVGYGQLAWKLRQDLRVTVMERTNFRYLEPNQLSGGLPDFATIDVSFISLAHIFPNLHRILAIKGEVVALIKPQFEAGRSQVGKKGIVKDPLVHQQVLFRTIQLAEAHCLKLKGLSFSPIQGNAGNIEFLAYFFHQSDPISCNSNDKQIIEETVRKAHQVLQKPQRSQ